MLRRGYEVYVGVLYNKEINFVALKNGKRIYVQVSDNIQSEETLKREIMLLLSIRDAYPKMIIARTGHKETQLYGVAVIDIAQWLLEKR